MNERKARGRQFFNSPGPTNIPDRILRAMDKPFVDYLSPEFQSIQQEYNSGVKRILKTNQRLFLYASTVHGAWEAAVTNLISPSDPVLAMETGYFSQPEAQSSDGPRRAHRALQPLARRWTRKTHRQSVPHRTSRRPERADAAGLSCNRRVGNEGGRHSILERGRRRRHFRAGPVGRGPMPQGNQQ